MKAVIATAYGSPDVLKIIDLPKPTPKANEVLVKVVASTVTSGDARVRARRVPKGFGLLIRLMFGRNKPTGILGGSFAGIIDEVGEKVTKFKKGDKVFGATAMGKGARAEYMTIKGTDGICLAPENIALEKTSALTFGGNTSLIFLQKLGKIKSGDSVLINGASGGLGIAAVQIAKEVGATVTAVSSEKNHQLLRDLGADLVIDYQKQNMEDLTETYDIIFDPIGKLSYFPMKKNLKNDGRFLTAVAGAGDYLKLLFKKINGYEKFVTGFAEAKQENLQYLKKLVEEGKYKPIIEKEYSLDQVADAHRHVDGGHKVGSVVVNIAK